MVFMDLLQIALDPGVEPVKEPPSRLLCLLSVLLKNPGNQRLGTELMAIL